MSTQFNYLYHKIAAVLIMLSPVAVVNAAAPVFIENSVLDNTLAFLFQPKKVNSEYFSLGVNSSNDIFVSFKDSLNKKIFVSQYLQGNTTLSDAQSVSTNTTRAFTQLRVSPFDDSIVLAFIENGVLKVNISSDGDIWENVTLPPVTGIPKVIKMELDSKGNSYLLYTNTVNKSEVLKFDGKDWTKLFTGGLVSTKSTAVSLTADIAINSQDEIYFVYRDTADANKTKIQYFDESDTIQIKTPIGLPTTSNYLRAVFDEQDNLHMAWVATGLNAGLSLYKVDDLDSLVPSWKILGKASFSFDFADNYGDNNYRKATYVFDLAFDSQHTPYIAYQQINNDVATKKQMQLTRFDGTDWQLIPYDLALVAKTGANLSTTNHHYLDLSIDAYDRPITVIRDNGAGHDNSGYVLRMNLIADPSNSTINLSVGEGAVSVGDLLVDDTDGDAITFNLAGADANVFTLNADTGELSFKEAPIVSTNTDYSVLVTASAGGDTTSATVQVTVVNNTSDDNNTDSDGDGVIDSVDVFPNDASETVDSDGDGVGDNGDIFPNDASETVDSDGDGVGDNGDDFPNDASETLDSDGDGVGNNADYYDNDPERWENEDIDLDGLENDIDLDDDGDDILDVNDTFPMDVSASIDTDGDGYPDNWNDGKSAVDSTTGLTTLDAFPNDSSEWIDTDGDGFGDNIDPNPNDPTDGTAPVFAQNIDTLVINATGTLTDISAAVATSDITALDMFDGVVIAVLESTKLVYASGKHEITLSATDLAGNKSTVEVKLAINPIVQLGASLIVEAGSQLSIPVVLSGPVATYPVVLDYTITSPTEETEGQLTIGKDTEQDAVMAELLIDVSADLQQGDELVIQFTQATNAVVPEMTKVSAVINNQNFAPTLQVSISQDGQPVSVIAPNLGPVTLTAAVTDLNSADEHSILFDVTGAEFVGEFSGDEAPNSWVFDPQNLETGSYPVTVTVAETNSDALLASALTIQVKVDSELTEIVVDSDQDGIPNIVDTSSDTTRLPIAVDEQPMQVLPGLILSIGNLAAGGDSTSIDAELIIDDAGVIIDDIHYHKISTITNFNVAGLTISGSSVAVVLPLVTSITIPADASYRKYSDAKGWFTFIEDENNSLASALKDSSGNCPAPSSTAYLTKDTLVANGLVEGYNCIQLTIEDGGANDADEMVNGTVVDPGVLVSELANAFPVIIVSKGAGISGQEVYIQASATDVEGDVVTFSWKQLTGKSVIISEPNSDTLRFIAPIVSERTELTFELTAYDGRDSESKVVQLSVLAEETELVLDQHRHSGSFGWLLSLVALIGLARRKLSK
jgi:hypothetical protein